MAARIFGVVVFILYASKKLQGGMPHSQAEIDWIFARQ
jgi:hypothetical protein